MELSYAILPEVVPSKVRHSQVTFPNGRVNLARLEKEIRENSGITVALAAVWVSGNDCVLSFKADLSTETQLVLDSIVSAHTGDPLLEQLGPMTSDRRPLVAFTKPDTSKKTIISHDWTDPTTWYTAAVRAETELATDSGDHTTYSLAHPGVIDLYHGKVFNEDFLRDQNNYAYRAQVTVNGVAKVEQDPHVGSGGDFTMNYPEGKIVFITPLQATDVVLATYHYATSSLFIVKPDAGTALRVTGAEVQFSTDVVLTDSIVFQPLGVVDVFAPQLVSAGIVPSGTKIPLGNPIIYKSFTDFQSDAVKAYPTFPAMGGNNWRASPIDVLVLNWDYVAETPLRSDQGFELHMFLQHHTPFQGWYATATFYCTSEPQ